MSMGDHRYQLGIDIGGTFTDITFFDRTSGTVEMEKHPTSPNPADTVKAAIDRLAEADRFDITDCRRFTHATTIAGNTLLERNGSQVGLLTTAGFRDIIEMRDESRYDLYDVHISFPDPIPARRFRAGVTERVAQDGTVVEPVDPDAVRRTVRELRQAGADAIAISFLHSYANDTNERTAQSVIEESFPDLTVSLSSAVAPQLGEYPRTTTTSINAYLKPTVQGYLTELEDYLQRRGFTGSFLIMTSGGGVVPATSARELPVRLLESGPTAGALVAQHLGERYETPDVIAFDMGGTTSKGCLIQEYELDKAFEFEAAREHEFKAGSGYPLLIPNVNLIEFSSGGGSIASIDELGTLDIGPESAGAVPGPACYDRGGDQATITDADVVLGYLREDTFAETPIDLDRSRAAEVIDSAIAEPLDIDRIDAAAGIYRTTNERISNAFKEHAAERGIDIRRSRMLAFGGAGPMHAEAIARVLDIESVVIPPKAGVLSSFGLLVTPKSVAMTEEIREDLSAIRADDIDQLFQTLTDEAVSVLDVDADARSELITRPKFDMRFEGQGFDEEVVFPTDRPMTIPNIRAAFETQYESIYGVLPEKAIRLTQLKLELTLRDDASTIGLTDDAGSASGDPVVDEREAYFPADGSFHRTQFLDRDRLAPTQTITTPCIIEGNGSTTVVGPDSDARIDDHRNIVVRC
ncbi:MAG: hydantoinase/oxoprolinase family protein [Halobacteriales archaeon]|nr:hydantoinase/oxoprolinase family protein [Halobacteriales archaeon]